MEFVKGFLMNLSIYLICGFFHIFLPLVLPGNYNDIYLGAIIYLSEFTGLILFYEFGWKNTQYYTSPEEKEEIKR